MTFPGVSVALENSVVSAGSMADPFDVLRHRDGSATVTAGTDFTVAFSYSATDLLEAGDDAVFSFAIETLAGSSGSLTLSGGQDATWGPDPAAATTALGTHAVSGESTLVVEAPWLTVADWLASDSETVLRVQVASGTVEIQQVKLRIWPPGGPVGGWSADPVTETLTRAPAFETAADTITGSLSFSTADTSAQALLRADLADETFTGGHPSVFPAASDVMLFGEMGASYNAISENYLAAGVFGAAYLILEKPAASGPGGYGTVWAYDPREVYGDADVHAFDVQADGIAWVQDNLTWDGENTAGGAVDGTMWLGWDYADEPYPAGTLMVDELPAGNALDSTSTTDTRTVTLPLWEAGRRVALKIWHDGHLGEIAYGDPGTLDRSVYYGLNDGGTWRALQYQRTVTYRYWDPTAAPEVPSKVRQLHRDDGLGVAPRRHFGGASRRNTGRHFGYD